MGANFLTRTVEKSKLPTQKELREHFRAIQDQDRFENGHSYSGGFGEANGLIINDKTFDDIEEAYDWLDEHAEKWEAAQCVTAIRDGKEHWVIGACCSS